MTETQWEPLDPDTLPDVAPVKDVWAGNADTDKYWAKED